MSLSIYKFLEFPSLLQNSFDFYFFRIMYRRRKGLTPEEINIIWDELPSDVETPEEDSSSDEDSPEQNKTNNQSLNPANIHKISVKTLKVKKLHQKEFGRKEIVHQLSLYLAYLMEHVYQLSKVKHCLPIFF